MEPGKIQPARTGLRAGVVAVLGFALLASLGLGWFYLSEQARLRDWSRQTERVAPQAPIRVGFMVPGVLTPPMRPASEAGLPDDAPVIGIEAGGRARAYALRSMSAPTRHIINDLLGGVPVTVTYCDLSDCTRAFGGEGETAPLPISQAGTYADEMLVKVGRVTYEQATAEVYEADPGHPPVPFPYRAYPHARTTWGAWKAAHPATDVYIYRKGDPNPQPGDPLPGDPNPPPQPGVGPVR